MTSHASPSAAQRANDDILLEVAFYLWKADLAAMALACHGWLNAAQEGLYRRVHMDLRSRGVFALERTLYGSAPLRGRVRHLWLRRGDEGTVYYPTFRWLALLPAGALRSVAFAAFSDMALCRDALRCPAARAAPALVVRSTNLVFAAQIEDWLARPALRALSLNLGLSFGTVRFAGAARLRRLSVAVDGAVRLGQLASLLDVLDPAVLERFDLETTYHLHPDDIPQWVARMARHAPALKHLSITSRHRVAFEPFMDDLVQHLPRLTGLHCGYGSFTPDLLARLPSAVEELTLVWGIDGSVFAPGPLGMGVVHIPAPGNVPFPCDAFSAAVAAPPGTRRALRRITVVLPELVRADLARFGAACARSGVVLDIRSMSDFAVDVLE